jgi:hypothetical protein
MNIKNNTWKYVVILFTVAFIVQISTLIPNATEISISNSTPIYGVGGSPVTVDSGIVFTGDDITGAKVYIDGGFQSGDTLSFTNQAGITGSYNSTNGVLTLSGSTTAANYQTAFRSIKFSSTSNSVNSRSITFSTDTGATSYKLSATGHYYKFVSVSGKTWFEAASLASATTYLGRKGYLATITSLAENQFVASKCAGDGWLGATDDGHDKQWYWVTGPEGEVTTYGYSGTKFMTQNPYTIAGTGIGVYSVETGFYQNFSANEPNDWAENNIGKANGENYLHMIASSGAWNDYSGNNTGTVGYIVEFGGMSGDNPEADNSLASKTITVSTSLVPPTDLTAVSGNGQAEVSFTASGSNGGSEITGYTVTSSPGGITASAISSPITVTGLTNGTAYTFKIYATNANGNSDPSTSSNSVTPSTIPGAPTEVSATIGNEQAEVIFNVPDNNGGATITGYTVTSSPGGITASGTESPITVSGLTNGTAYTFEVFATNAAGNGSTSAASNSVTPSTVPDAPTDVIAEAGSGQAIVSFSAPTNNGGAEITGYTVTSSPGGITASATSSPITITGLTNGTIYTFTVYATNLSGNGAYSIASEIVTPFNRPKSKNTETQVVVIVNGVQQNLGTQTESTEDGLKAVSLSVSEEGVTKQIESIIEQEKDNPLVDKIVEIPVVGSDIGKADVLLTGDLISEMEKEDFSLKVIDDKVSYIIPAAEIQIPEIAKELNTEEDLSNVEIHVIITKPSASSLAEIEKNAELQGYEVLIPPMTVEVVAINSETKQEINIERFSSYAQKMFEIPAGLDLSKITTGVVYNDDGTFSHIPTEIIKVGEKYFAKLNSLTNSTYSIIWNPTTFSDMENRWAKDPANNMGGRLIVSGVGNNKFEPDRAITRGEFASIVTKALGIYRTHVGLDHYTDISFGSAYYDSASIAEDYGLVTGYSDGTFKPKNKITRQEAMVIMTKAAKIAKLQTVSGKTLNDFLDKDQVSKWAKAYVETNVEQGIILGFKGKLNPKANISRAEVVALFERLLENANLIKN